MNGTTLATIGAILLGPILAVLITRFIDNRRLDYMRRLEVFRTLMKFRARPLTQEYVGGLNSVEIEFARDKKVITAWKALLEDFSGPWPTAQNEIDSATRKRQTLQAKLISTVADALGIRIEQLDISTGGYYPRGWDFSEMEQIKMRQLFLEILEGKRALQVEEFSPPGNGGGGKPS